jgi:hypothetical protein
VRLKGYEVSVAQIAGQMQRAGIREALIECAWGDPLGIIFEGRSLPDPPDAAAIDMAAQELARWSWLFDDPLAELELLSIRGTGRSLGARPGQMPGWMAKLNAIKAYAPSLEMSLLLNLLAMADPPEVERLVTVGSQSPYFYEIDALASVKRPNVLPAGFPPWLNIFDRNDFLSFVGGRLFPGQVEDVEVNSGVTFPEAHSACLGSEAVWVRVQKFIAA